MRPINNKVPVKIVKDIEFVDLASGIAVPESGFIVVEVKDLPLSSGKDTAVIPSWLKVGTKLVIHRNALRPYPIYNVFYVNPEDAYAIEEE